VKRAARVLLVLAITGPPTLRGAGVDLGPAARGWRMFHDVGRDRCQLGLDDASGARVWPGALPAAGRAEWRAVVLAFTEDRAPASAPALCAAVPSARCALWCPGEDGFVRVPAELTPVCP
jgi:hypothetical protein